MDKELQHSPTSSTGSQVSGSGAVASDIRQPRPVFPSVAGMGVSQRFETHIDGMLSAIVCKYHLGIMKVYQGKICLHHFPNLYYTITLMSKVSLLIEF